MYIQSILLGSVFHGFASFLGFLKEPLVKLTHQEASFSFRILTGEFMPEIIFEPYSINASLKNNLDGNSFEVELMLSVWLFFLSLRNPCFVNFHLLLLISVFTKVAFCHFD